MFSPIFTDCISSAIRVVSVCRFFFILTSAFLFPYSAVETSQGMLSWDNFMRLAVQWKTMRSQSSSLFCSFEDPLSQERGKHEYCSLACTGIASTMPARYSIDLRSFKSWSSFCGLVFCLSSGYWVKYPQCLWN